MTIHGLSRWAIAGGIVAALGAGSQVQAQVDTTRPRIDTTARARSTQRIPIRKEARGEVSVPTARVTRPDSMTRADSIARTDSIERSSQARIDSIMRRDRARNDSIAAAERARADAVPPETRIDSLALAARTDSLAKAEQARADSISRAEHARADSIARVDSVAAAALVIDNQRMPPARRMPGAFYMGLAAGAANPVGDMQDLGYDGGLNVAVPLGWHRPGSVLGFRLLLGYSQLNGASFTGAGTSPVILSNPDPKIYSAEASVNARFPFNERRTSAFYLVGGGGLYMFSNFGQGSALAAYLGNDVLDPNDEANESTISKWGVNGGAGLEFGIGRNSLFLESRVVNVFTGRGDDVNFDNMFGSRGTTARWIPLILGFTIR